MTGAKRSSIAVGSRIRGHHAQRHRAALVRPLLDGYLMREEGDCQGDQAENYGGASIGT